MLSGSNLDSKSISSCQNLPATPATPKPVERTKGECDQDSGQLTPMHSREQHRAEQQSKRREEPSGGQAKGPRLRLLSSQHRERRANRAIHEHSSHGGKHRVPPKTSGCRKQSQQYSKSYDGNIRGAKPRMDRGENFRELSMLRHRERDARSVQHVRAEVPVGGDQSSRRY